MKCISNPSNQIKAARCADEMQTDVGRTGLGEFVFRILEANIASS